MSDITLTIEFDYYLNGAEPSAVRDQLHKAIWRLTSHDTLTGSLDATLDAWRVSPPEEEPPKQTLSVEMFADLLVQFDAGDYYRQALNEDDELGNFLNGEYTCRLEILDKPAYRQALNDYIDDKVKAHEWVTFDNGNTYHTADDVKEAIDEHDESEWDYSPELKEAVGWWL